MSSKQTSRFFVQCEAEARDSEITHWEDWYDAGTSIHEAEALLAKTCRLLNSRKPTLHTGRYRLVCRVTVVTDHLIGEAVDTRLTTDY